MIEPEAQLQTDGKDGGVNVTSQKSHTKKYRLPTAKTPSGPSALLQNPAPDKINLGVRRLVLSASKLDPSAIKGVNPNVKSNDWQKKYHH
mgnify:CR=1 FL=1